ncbi:methyl-accepting chemotaxis protein [Desulfobacula phenolica]|nr:methyl-accepting chemotaxis protein [Desulfobacula phenolica]
MKTIKVQMLVKYSIVMILIVAAIGMIVSWQLDNSITKQAVAISNGLVNQNNATIASYGRVLDLFINDVKENVRTTTKEISNNSSVRSLVEMVLATPLSFQLAEIGKQKAIDYSVVLDIKGGCIATFPADADQGWLNNYYKESKYGPLIKELINSKDKDAVLKNGLMAKFTADFLKALNLSHKDVSGKGTIGILSADIILDDFGGPVGVCINGKLLNDFSDNPLKKLFKTIDSASAIYFEGIPLVFAGFDPSKQAVPDEASRLALDPDIQKDILSNPDGIYREVLLADKKYLTKCSVMTSFDGETLGSILVGVPKENVSSTIQTLIDSGLAAKRKVQTWIIGVALVGISLFILGSLQISKGIVRPILKVVDGLSDSASRLASGAIQISSDSKSLAEGSSGQASAIEETSASIEEMSVMTKQNADNAQKANLLMQEGNHVIKQANQAITNLNTSMNEISTASEKISNIIKTIDEISFQTNLLALNAAVEAARAGEAGAGFAVVADEVRSLSMRAAQAAKSTSQMIEGTVNTIGEGSAMVSQASEVFIHLTESISDVAALLNEISTASNEQAFGIEQVNKAVLEMDKVTRRNADSAKESANTSSEISGHAQQMKVMVGELAALV